MYFQNKIKFVLLKAAQFLSTIQLPVPINAPKQQQSLLNLLVLAGLVMYKQDKFGKKGKAEIFGLFKKTSKN